MDKEQKKIEISTPFGTMVAVASPDKENPGIVIMFLDTSGTEYTSCSMQVTGKSIITTNVYGGNECADIIYSRNQSVPEPCKNCPYAQGKIITMVDPCPECKSDSYNTFRTWMNQMKK